MNIQKAFNKLLSSKSLAVYNIPEYIFQADSDVAGPKYQVSASLTLSISR